MSKPAFKKAKHPTVLIILDGWGHRDQTANNGIALAHKPFFDHLLQTYPHTLIDGSGPAVGLPKGIMGNSEVGHMNIGAGRILYSGLSQIYQAIAEQSFFNNPALRSACQHVKKKSSTLHLLGLLSDGAVHSHEDHLYALLEMAKREGVAEVLVHCFLDGRDTAPRGAAIQSLLRLLEKCQTLGVGRIASISGRYFAMDRDQNWQRTEKAFWAMCGKAECVSDPIAYVQACYAKNVGDEFVEPVTVCAPKQNPIQIKADDAMIFFNFRADRARQISHAFVDEVFSAFERQDQALPHLYVCFFPYDAALSSPVAFLPQYPKHTLGEVLSDRGLKQLRLAETEKYAHVTFFFNGGKDAIFPGEERVLIASAKDVATYDLKPEMSANSVTEALLQGLHDDRYDFILCNFANTDMVGHTAVPKAIIKAVETVDQCLQKIVTLVLQKQGHVLITADHGNAETMVDAKGLPMTAHTTNLVPFVLVSDAFKSAQLKASGGRLCDVAPTVLQVMQIDKPNEMTGKSLLVD